jgi:hypothetical protein
MSSHLPGKSIVHLTIILLRKIYRDITLYMDPTDPEVGKTVTRTRNVLLCRIFRMVKYMKVNSRNSLAKKMTGPYLFSEPHASWQFSTDVQQQISRGGNHSYTYVKKRSRNYSPHTTFIIHVNTATCFDYTYVAIIRLDVETWIRVLH